MNVIKLNKIRTIEELSHYKETWDQILASNQNTNPFIEFDWILNWWSHIGKGKSIEILAVENEGNWIGFFPFQFTYKWNTTVVEFVGRDEADFMDVIVYEAEKQKAITFILGHLIKTIPNVIFHLHGLLSSSKTTTIVKAYLKNGDFPNHIFTNITPYIHIDLIDMDEYMKPRSKLHGLNRRERRIQLIGNLKLATIDPVQMDSVFTLHDRHWKHRIDASKFKNQAYKEFYLSLLSVKDRPIEVKVDALMFNNQMIAFTYGFLCRGRYVSFMIGHDDDYQLYSPGRILLKRLIEDSSKQGIKIFDMNVGDEPYKLDWNTGLDTANTILFSSNEWSAKLMGQMIKSKGSIRAALNKNHQWVKSTRLILGKMSHLAHHSKEVKWLKGLTSFLFTRRSHDVYRQRKGHAASSGFQLLTHEEVIKEEREHGHVNKLFYSGSLPFRANDASIFWVNSKIMRLDEVDFLHPLPKQSFFLDEWQVHQLTDICSFLRHDQKQVKDIYISTTKQDRSLTSHLTYLGFSRVNRITQISMFNRAVTRVTKTN